METQLVKQSNQLGFVEQSLQQIDSALKYATHLVESKMLPKHYYNKDGTPLLHAAQSALLVIQMGREIGLSTLQAIQQIVPVQGMLSLKGDGAKALIMASGICKEWKEEEIGTGDGFGIKITSTRKDTNETKSTSFTIQDATRAGLWITDAMAASNPNLKYSAWYKYGKSRMLRYRALGFIARDLYSDVLQGIVLTEEAEDYGRESAKTETESGIMTNANTEKQGQMVNQALSKVGGRNPKKATHVEDATYTDVTEQKPEAEQPKTEPEPVKESAPIKEPKGVESDKMNEFMSIPADNEKMKLFVGTNKKWCFDYLDSKFAEKGFASNEQWFEISKCTRTLKTTAEILIALRDTTYEDMCSTYLGAMPPAPVHESKKVPPVEKPHKISGKFVIPAPHRDMPAQEFVMEKVVEVGKNSDQMEEWAVARGFENAQDFLENATVEMIDQFLMS